MDKSHEFSPVVAERYGINAAVLFQHICYLSQESPTRWVDLSIEELARKYPYMGRDQVWRALRLLITPGRKTAALVNRKPRELGTGYLYAPAANDGFCDLPHRFSVGLAVKIGVVPAIIYRNVSYWVRKNWMNRADTVYSQLDPVQFDYDECAMQEFAWTNSRKAAACFTTVDAWVKLRPYVSRRSAFRAFALLVDEGMISSTPLPHKIPLWSLSARELNSFKRKMLGLCSVEIRSAKTKRVVPKPNGLCQNQTGCAKTKRDFSDDSTEDESLDPNPARVERSTSEESVPALRVKRSVKHDYDEFGSAEHRRSKVAAGAFKDLNQPARPSRKIPREREEKIGWPKKRHYQKADEWADLNE